MSGGREDSMPLNQVMDAFPDMNPADAVKMTEVYVAVADQTGADVETVISEAVQANNQ